MSRAATSSGASGGAPEEGGRARAPYTSTLALTATMAVAGALILIALVMLLAPSGHGFAGLGQLVNQQNQSAKTDLYVLVFVVVLPASLWLGPRLADAVARRVGADGLAVLSALLAGGLAGALILARLSGRLPWGSGLGTVLAAGLAWTAAAVAILGWALRRPATPPVLSAERSGQGLTAKGPASWLAANASAPRLTATAGVAVFAALACVTDLSALNLIGLLLGAAVAALALLAMARPLKAVASRRGWVVLDAAVVVLVLLAIPDVVIFHPSLTPPNSFFLPGLVQSQHDFFLGPVNQLLSGGTLLVDAPGSQYGVGSLYFLAGWFHLVPIGYGTFGLLDGILTALFYAAGYLVLRIAGAGRAWAAGALLVGVVTLVYHLEYPVGVLPEMGPMRFGLPMVALLAMVAAARYPAHARGARAAAYATLGVSAVWAVETFGFTLVVVAAMLALETWWQPPGQRRRWVLRHLGAALGACVIAHVLFALITLAGSGQLPDWGQYYAYVHSFLLGGKAGQVTYGFSDWSPGLALGAGILASGVGVLLLTRRAPGLVRAQRCIVAALAGTTAYAVALFSYFDSRSSTYLLPYLALPALMAAVLWLVLIRRARPGVKGLAGLGPPAFALGIAVVMFGAAWPGVGGRLSDTALAHAYPGGGLPSALSRLKHPPPIDPRTPLGQALLARYVPGPRPIVLLSAAPDLATEILMHSRVANGLAVGDPGMDSYVPSNWTPIVGPQIARLHSGTRLLMDEAALTVDATLRAHPSLRPLEHPLALGGTQLEWILQQLNQRFRLVPILRAADGFVVVELEA